jgi:hypothetical protein
VLETDAANQDIIQDYQATSTHKEQKTRNRKTAYPKLQKRTHLFEAKKRSYGRRFQNS